MNNFDQSQEFFETHGVSRTFGKFVEQVSRLLKRSTTHGELYHSLAGICSEAGEIGTTIKKHIEYEVPLDKDNILEEVGDLLFYLQALSEICEFDLMDAMAYNIIKLNKRYPSGGFSTQEAVERADKNE